jgi:hypothetical protein
MNQGSSANAAEVEDLVIELHDSATYVLVASAIGTLQTDGTLQATFSTAPSGSYYIAVKGSNIVQTWSAGPQAIGSTPLTYDFSSDAAQAYGNNMKELETGVWGFFSGDMNQDDSIDPTDYPLWESDSDAFSFGVYATDLNGDGSVDPTDYPLWESNSDNFIFAYYPTL